jgi:predicted methyltransferase
VKKQLLGQFVALAATTICLVGCTGLDPEASARMADGAIAASRPSSSAIAQPAASDASLKYPQRNPPARTEEERRLAAAVLDYFGIELGMTVLDLYTGAGRYSELLYYRVGPSGRVVMHNNTPYLSLAGTEFAARYRAGMTPNVEELVMENDELELPDQKFDAVVMIMAYHDVYYADEKAGWMRIDRTDFLGEVYEAMKPGAVLGIIDYAAAPGSPAKTSGTLHRIDPQLIRRDMIAAGFVFEGESDILRNPKDDYTRAAFDEAVRDGADRVVMRFRKPLAEED